MERKSGMVLSRLSANQRRLLISLSVALLAGAIYYWLATFEPMTRTVFIEEYHTGEAGRAAYLFGEFRGEGDTWQSVYFSPLASLLSWASFSLLGFGHFALRAPFVLLSTIAVGVFALVVMKRAAGDKLIIASAVGAFLSSPFLLELRATSVNETLYLPIFTLMLWLASRFDEAASARQRLATLFALGVVSSLGFFVKTDGAILLAASGLVIASKTVFPRPDFAAAGAFAAGAGLGLASYFILMIAAFGLATYLDGVRHAVAIMSAYSGAPDSIGEGFIRALRQAAKNFDIYFPLISAVIAPVLTLGVLMWRSLSTAGKISWVLLLLFILSLPVLPLIYWKRFVLASAAALYLCFDLVAAHRQEGFARIGRVALIISAIVSVAAWSFAFSSEFNGMWRVDSFWRFENGWLRFAAASALGGCFVFLLARAPLKTTRAAFLLICAATALAGAKVMGSAHARDAYAVGKRIADVVGDGTVVADHNAFRFAGYFSKARYSFVHENDIGFPDTIIERAKEQNPDFVVVTNTYKKLEKLVRKNLPCYTKVAKEVYVHEPDLFSRRNVRHQIVVFQKTACTP